MPVSLIGLKKDGIPVILLQQEVITPDIDPIWTLSDLELYRTLISATGKRLRIGVCITLGLDPGRAHRVFRCSGVL